MTRVEVLGSHYDEQEQNNVALTTEKDLARLVDTSQTAARRLEAFARLFQDNHLGKRMYYRYSPTTYESTLSFTVNSETSEQQVSRFVAGVRTNIHTRPVVQPNLRSTTTQEINLKGDVVREIMEYLQKAVPEVFPKNGDTSPSALNIVLP